MSHLFYLSSIYYNGSLIKSSWNGDTILMFIDAYGDELQII